MAEGDIFLNDKKFSDLGIPLNNPDVIIFNCQKLIIEPNEIITDWPDGFPVAFDKFQRLVFTDGKKRVTYSRLLTENITKEVESKI